MTDILRNIIVLCITIAVSAAGGSQPVAEQAAMVIIEQQSIMYKATTQPTQIEPSEVFEKASKWANSFNEFTCKFIKQERLDGKLNAPQLAKVKSRQSPALVRMEWTSGDVQVSLWSEGWDYLKVDPKGWWPVKMKLTNKEVLARSLNPITQFGFIKSIDRLKVVCDEAESTIVEELRDTDNKLMGYALIMHHSYVENGTTFNAVTTIVFDADFRLESTGQTDQNGVKFNYIWKNINTNASVSEADLKI